MSVATAGTTDDLVCIGVYWFVCLCEERFDGSSSGVEGRSRPCRRRTAATRRCHWHRHQGRAYIIGRWRLDIAISVLHTVINLYVHSPSRLWYCVNVSV